MESTPDKTKKSVLIVDDHPLVREWLAALIRQQPDLTVSGEAETAGAGFQTILRSRPNVAVVDISLKDRSGLDLIKEITTLHPSVAVIVLTVHDEKIYAERALQAGARGYIMKGESARNIIDGIRQVLAGRICFSRRMTAIFMERFLDGHALAGGSATQPLSDEELETVRLIGLGLSMQQIADTLHVNLRTVQTCCARIQEKSRWDSAAELVWKAVGWPENPATE